jgi:hypothetical protein
MTKSLVITSRPFLLIIQANYSNPCGILSLLTRTQLFCLVLNSRNMPKALNNGVE